MRRTIVRLLAALLQALGLGWLADALLLPLMLLEEAPKVKKQHP